MGVGAASASTIFSYFLKRSSFSMTSLSSTSYSEVANNDEMSDDRLLCSLIRTFLFVSAIAEADAACVQFVGTGGFTVTFQTYVLIYKA